MIHGHGLNRRETLSAAVEGAYLGLSKDPRIGIIQPQHEQLVKSHMVRVRDRSTPLVCRCGCMRMCWIGLKVNMGCLKMLWLTLPDVHAPSTLSTHAQLDFMTAAFGGHSRCSSPRLWTGQKEVASLGLQPVYFDCMMEHLQVG